MLKEAGMNMVPDRNPLVNFTYPDYFSAAHKLCVYVDGTYWHRNSSKKDSLQNRVLRAAGYKVWRIPEKATGDEARLRAAIERKVKSLSMGNA